MPSENHSISFCIVCMNRLHQLKETLLQNIRNNNDYDALQYILLDYNSQDGMEEWIRENMNEYISNGTMIYYKTFEPLSFNHSHSKNLAFKLANNNILCNINADHYTGSGFAHYINEAFIKDENIVLTPIDFYRTKTGYHPPKDVFGRVCVKRDHFQTIKGFDERMTRYGFEDWDFVNRLELINIKRVLIEDFRFLGYIAHEEGERFSLNTDHLQGLYVHYCTSSTAELIFLYKDQQFEKGVLIDNSTIHAADYRHAWQPGNYRFEYSVQDPGWQTGTWKETPCGTALHFSDKHKNNFVLLKTQYNNHDILEHTDTGSRFYKITETGTESQTLKFNYFFYNRSIMEKNLINKTSVVNTNDFGKATVFRNFQYNAPLFI
jgi:hypothetical protein